MIQLFVHNLFLYIVYCCSADDQLLYPRDTICPTFGTKRSTKMIVVGNEQSMLVGNWNFLLSNCDQLFVLI